MILKSTVHGAGIESRAGEVRRCDLPQEALSRRFRASGAYTDCYVTELARTVSHAEFVEAFYTTALFKLERWILRACVARPSTDAEARAVALGELDSFAAWSVEERAPNQVLLRDLTGRTCSWLMVAAIEPPPGTRIYFGSVVAPVRDPKTGAMGLGPVHGRLIGFHKLYSRMLLGAAARRLAVAHPDSASGR
jgi:hypothetical protein